MNPPPLLDQSEMLVKFEQLQLREKFATATLAQLGERVAPPTLPANDLCASVAMLDAHVRLLEAKISGLAASKPTPANVAPAPAATVSKASPAPSANAEPKTATEKLLAAHGVNSIAELSAKKRGQNSKRKQTGLA